MPTSFVRTLASSAALFPLLLAGCASLPTTAPLDSKTVHAEVLALDTHVDIPLDYMDGMDPGTDTEAQVDLNKMDVGGLDAAFFIVYTPQTEVSAQGIYDAQKIAETRYKAIDQLVTKYADRIELAKTSDDVRRIAASGKRVALIGMENAYPIGNSVASVPMWAERGVRYMGITHMGHNQFGDSSNPSTIRNEPESQHGGLSELGKELVDAMNAAGIMVDVSHAGKQTMMQAVARSKVPVIASHSGVLGVAESLRNLDDEQLRALADTGGVAQMVALGVYVKALTPEQESFKTVLREDLGIADDKAFAERSDEVRAIYNERYKEIYDISPRATIADYADHIDHAVKIAGIDHVGIASDFDGGGGIDGWQDATETENVTKELIKRGYSQEDIAKIWGGNLLRVLDAVQDGATK
jgi:membrane dipeptidase